MSKGIQVTPLPKGLDRKVCDYCGEVFEDTGQLKVPTEEPSTDPGELSYYGIGFRYHMECLVHKKWVERGWADPITAPRQ